QGLIQFLGPERSNIILNDIQDISNISPISESSRKFSRNDFLRRALSRQNLATPPPMSNEALTVEKTFRGPFYQSPTFGVNQLGEWRHTDWLTPEIVDQMKKNGVIKTGLFLRKAPILATVKKMKISHEVPRIEGFLNHVMQPIFQDLFWKALTAFDY